jgi:hypothetical protein
VDDRGLAGPRCFKSPGIRAALDGQDDPTPRSSPRADGLGQLVRDLVRVTHIDLADATIRSGRHYVRSGGIVVTLTRAASTLLRF